MPQTINGAVRQDTQSLCNRGMDSLASATGFPPFLRLVKEVSNDPAAQFRKQPHDTSKAKELVCHETTKNLPIEFSKTSSPEVNKIRMLIGLIYQDVNASKNQTDIAKLNKICGKLIEATGDAEKQLEVAGKHTEALSSLVSRYSLGAIEKVTNQVIQHSMNAWKQYYQDRSLQTRGMPIFKPCLDVCKSALTHSADKLKARHVSMDTMVQEMRYLRDVLTAISKTMTSIDAELVTPAPKGPETLNLNPDAGADNQRVLIPTGPGQGGITLNITSQGGSVGDITRLVGAANTAPVDSKHLIIKSIIDSELDRNQKVDLIKFLFDKNNIGGGSNVLENLASVQGYKQEQAVDTPQRNLAAQKTVGRIGKSPSQHRPNQVAVQSQPNTPSDDFASATQDVQNSPETGTQGVIIQGEPNGASDGASSSTDAHMRNGDLTLTTSQHRPNQVAVQSQPNTPSDDFASATQDVQNSPETGTQFQPIRTNPAPVAARWKVEFPPRVYLTVRTVDPFVSQAQAALLAPGQNKTIEQNKGRKNAFPQIERPSTEPVKP